MSLGFKRLNHSLVEEHHYIPLQTTAFSEAIKTSIFTPDTFLYFTEILLFHTANDFF